jgi:hypothetical protein
VSGSRDRARPRARGDDVQALARREIAEHDDADDRRHGAGALPDAATRRCELGEIAADALRHVVRRRDQPVGAAQGSARTCRATRDVEAPLAGRR